MVECDMCGTWCHKSCAAATDKVLQATLMKGKKANIPFWKCQVCVELWQDLRKKREDDNKLKTQVTEMMNRFAKEKDNLMTQVTELIKQFAEEKEVLWEVIRQKENEIEGLRCVLDQNDRKIHDKTINACKLRNDTHQQGEETPLSQTTSVNETTDEEIERQSHGNSRSPLTHEETVINPTTPDGEKRKEDGFRTVRSRRRRGHPCLIVGSSLVRDARRHIERREARVIALPGATVRAVQREIQNMDPDPEVRAMVLHVGGNDVKDAPSPDYIIGDLYNLVEDAKVKFTKANIVVNGILWRKGFSRKMVQIVNNDIRWMTNCLDVGFADPNLIIERRHYANDQVHLNAEGNRIFAHFLKNSLSMLANVKRT